MSNTKVRLRISSSAKTLLAKIYLIDLLQGAVRDLKRYGFKKNEIIDLINEFWSEV